MENVALLKEYVKTGLASYTFRPWKLAMLGVGTLFLVVGGGLSVVERRDSSSVRDTVAKSEKQVDGPVAATSTERPGVHSIAPGDHPTLPPGIILDDPPTGPTDDESKSGGEPTGDAQGVSSVDPANWSPVFLKGGFGFFVGFCVGFAIRTLLRLAALVIGFNLLFLVVFSSFGWVEIHWDVVGNQFDLWVDSLGPDFDSIQSFLHGRLPTTGLTGLGLYTGLRKK